MIKPTYKEFQMLDLLHPSSYAEELYTIVIQNNYDFLSELIWYEYYVNKKSTNEIAEILKWTGMNVVYKMKSFGFKTREPGSSARFKDPGVINLIKKSNKYFSWRELTKILGCSKSTINRIMHKQGVYDREYREEKGDKNGDNQR